MKQTYTRILAIPFLFSLFSFCVLSAQASVWSDTSIGYRHGTSFAEPFEGNDIAKSIVDLQSVSGYAYGTNFFNVDMLISDKNDPDAPSSSDGAQETYVVYRNTVDIGKVTGDKLAFGAMRGLGVTAGFDWNTKNDSGYNSNKRMFVVGPTLMLDVPGFMNVSVLGLWESNAPYSDFSGISTPRYHYKSHAELDMAWGIPFKLGIPLSFEGYFDYITAKGKDEFGGATKPETHFDSQVMYAISKTFKVGIEYEYWKNKFGNDSSGPAGSGAFAKTPMIRAEYHF